MSNEYEPMDVDRLLDDIAKFGPLYIEGVQSGFHVDHVDDDYATIMWKNSGTEEEIHRDKLKPLPRQLSRNGYEVKLMQPAKTTLMVRRVVPYVKHGPFESLVEKMYFA